VGSMTIRAKWRHRECLKCAQPFLAMRWAQKCCSTCEGVQPCTENQALRTEIQAQKDYIEQLRARVRELEAEREADCDGGDLPAVEVRRAEVRRVEIRACTECGERFYAHGTSYENLKSCWRSVCQSRARRKAKRERQVRERERLRSDGPRVAWKEARATCRDCQQTFSHCGGRGRVLTRCPRCRYARKAEQARSGRREWQRRHPEKWVKRNWRRELRQWHPELREARLRLAQVRSYLRGHRNRGLQNPEVFASLLAESRRAPTSQT
jgi:hypothetical protein